MLLIGWVSSILHSMRSSYSVMGTSLRSGSNFCFSKTNFNSIKSVTRKRFTLTLSDSFHSGLHFIDSWNNFHNFIHYFTPVYVSHTHTYTQIFYSNRCNIGTQFNNFFSPRKCIGLVMRMIQHWFWEQFFFWFFVHGWKRRREKKILEFLMRMNPHNRIKCKTKMTILLIDVYGWTSLLKCVKWPSNALSKFCCFVINL